jgi:hypothetical protein
MLVYNLFRARGRDVVCAVPEDRPVPPFVHEPRWEFEGKVAEDQVRLPRATNTAVRFNGFYIFHPFERPKLKS